MTHWTPRLVEARLAEAAAILKRLPTKKTQRLLDRLPAQSGDFREHLARDTIPGHVTSPTSIDRMNEALSWTRDLSKQDYAIVWWRAFGLPWKTISRRVGMQRTATYTNWNVAVSRITLRLNGSPIARDASQRHIIECARAAKR